MQHKSLRTQRGFSLVETLASMSVLAIILIGITHSIHTSFLTTKRVERESVGFELARQKLEELAATPTASLTSALSGTETLTSNSISFSRQTTVVVNADNSRTVTVAVTGTAGQGGNATLTETLAELGNK